MPQVSDEDGLVPQDVAELVRACIDRLETLHVLLLLHATANRTWTVRDVSRERRSSVYGVEMSLRLLVEHGFLAREDDAYWFSPRTPELAERTAMLSACYRARPSAVVALIFSAGSRA